MVLSDQELMNRDSGVSMVEILVAMLLFAVLMIGLIPVFLQSMGLASKSASITSSSRVANGAIENARVIRFSEGDKTLWCQEFIDEVSSNIEKFPTDATDGRAELQVSYAPTCAAGDRVADLHVTVKQGTKLLTDVKTKIWLN